MLKYLFNRKIKHNHDKFNAHLFINPCNNLQLKKYNDFIIKNKSKIPSDTVLQKTIQNIK